MLHFVFIVVNSILPNLLGCLPFGLQPDFSSFSKLGVFKISLVTILKAKSFGLQRLELKL